MLGKEPAIASGYSDEQSLGLRAFGTSQAIKLIKRE
jgi:hypothetical protein